MQTPNPRRKPTVISMFSGCGGMDLGFKKAGFRIVWANDIDEDCCETYRRNIGKITLGDIQSLEMSTDEICSPDVLAAGFPCQAYSNAGSRRGTMDKRGILYRDALRYVRMFKPRIVLFENVRGLMSVKVNGKLLVESILNDLEGLGYAAYISLLKASDYGVPQRRLRLFIVAVSRDFGTGLNLPLFPNRVEGADMTLGCALSGIPTGASNQDELMPLNPQAVKLGKLIPPGGSWKSIPDDKLPERMKHIKKEIVRYRWPNFYRRFASNEVAGTITAAFKPENAGVWHPVEDRIMSVREVARIQTFPDDFEFFGRNIKSKYQQIGNAVPPLLAQLFAEQFKKIILGRHKPIDPALNHSWDFASFKKSGRPFRSSDPPIAYQNAR